MTDNNDLICAAFDLFKRPRSVSLEDELKAAIAQIRDNDDHASFDDLNQELNVDSHHMPEFPPDCDSELKTLLMNWYEAGYAAGQFDALNG